MIIILLFCYQINEFKNIYKIARFIKYENKIYKVYNNDIKTFFKIVYFFNIKKHVNGLIESRKSKDGFYYLKTYDFNTCETMFYENVE